jgi:hypothetical protein
MPDSIEASQIARCHKPCTGAALLRPSFPGHTHEHDLFFLSSAVTSARNLSLHPHFDTALFSRES